MGMYLIMDWGSSAVKAPFFQSIGKLYEHFGVFMGIVKQHLCMGICPNFKKSFNLFGTPQHPPVESCAEAKQVGNPVSMACRLDAEMWQEKQKSYPWIGCSDGSAYSRVHKRIKTLLTEYLTDVHCLIQLIRVFNNTGTRRLSCWKGKIQVQGSAFLAFRLRFRITEAKQVGNPVSMACRLDAEMWQEKQKSYPWIGCSDEPTTTEIARLDNVSSEYKGTVLLEIKLNKG
ncbi:UNVERIFIED_CONTAM: hypothetical protein FKN15_055929 [Acipenser sinensis]